MAVAAEASGGRVNLELPDDVLEAVAVRVAEIVLERLGPGEAESEFEPWRLMSVEETAAALGGPRQEVVPRGVQDLRGLRARALEYGAHHCLRLYPAGGSLQERRDVPTLSVDHAHRLAPFAPADQKRLAREVAARLGRLTEPTALDRLGTAGLAGEYKRA